MPSPASHVSGVALHLSRTDSRTIDQTDHLTLQVNVLGRIGVERSGTEIPLGGSKQRLLLAVLAAHRGRFVSTDRLCDALWGSEQPATAATTLQSHVSRLRRSLRPEIEIEAHASSYALISPAGSIDAERFERAVASVDRATDLAAVRDILAEALSLWHGPAFAEFADNEWIRPEALKLDELRLSTTERWIQARLELGDDLALIGDLERMVAANPLREGFWRQLMGALHRSGRSPEALRRARELRAMLRDELGLDPSPAFRQLESRILADDPRLGAGGGEEPGAPAPRLIGREADLDRLRSLVDDHRIITLVGTGGVGKTQLALRLASDNHGFDKRAAVVELAVVRESSAVAATIATALDIQQRQHHTIEDTLVEVLSEGRQLLVLDNCEHLIEAAASLVRRLSTACPRLHLVMTSREPLSIRGEVVFVVAPLGIAQGDDATDLAASPAIELFIERAGAARSGFAVTPELLPVIAQLCRRLDGVPLAIELAAIRLRSLSPAGIIERLDHRFKLLNTGDRAGDPRHQTLQNLVEWSYLLLTPAEQRLFARLSIFSGSFNLTAVDAVCADDADASDDLFGLVDKSMVQVSDFDEPRYMLLETLREYGRQRLDASGETAEFADRHRAWFLQLAEQAAAGMTGADELTWVLRVEHDFDNLRAAHRHSIQTVDVDSAIRLVAALREYAFRRIHYELTGWAVDTVALDGAEDHPRFPVAVAIVAYGHFVRGDLTSAIATAIEADAATQRLGVRSSGLAERTLGNAYLYLGDVEHGLHWMDRMIESARASKAPARLAHALYMRSVAETSLGRALRGATLAGECRAWALSAGSPTALAQAAYALGIALEETEPAEAASQLRHAAQLALDGANRWVEAFARTEILWLDACDGEARVALGGYAAVIEAWYRGGDWANQWLSLRHVRSILHQLGDHEAAAVVHGALENAGTLMALPSNPADAAHLQAEDTSLRSELGPAFAEALQRGASMSDSALVAYVLGRIDALTHPS